MSHFAFVVPPFLGHLNPMLALSAALVEAGHRATFFGMADMEAAVGGQGGSFTGLGGITHPPGRLASMTAHMAAPGGFGLFPILADMARTTDMLCAELPEACRARRVDGIITDQLEPAGGLVAAHLGLPFVSVANALPIRRDPTLPPPFTDWPYDPSPQGLRRNRGGYRVADLLMWPMARTIARQARRLGLGKRGSLDDCLSPFADLTQIIPALDFPRSDVPPTVHACGPLRRTGPLDDVEDLRRGDRPLVFASLGTLQGGRVDLFRRIAEACADLGLHLVIAHGGRLNATEAASLPGSPIVRAFVPQQALLRHAALAITNGGLNTVLDAAAAAVPLLIVPIAFEQGAIAARVVHAGLGRSLPRRRLTRQRLSQTIREILDSADIAGRARSIAASMATAGGVSAAVAIIEAVMRTGHPFMQPEPMSSRSARLRPA
ncbi:glycosyltransferase [Lichenifustis flavocetrariae]|uniref:Glycosyltransferase n=1 Tax=Lichenifustis flavocetrariae TaxID=2949735 RepID=A0AA41YU85_9HYPH|nr:glycosyltransferase [Lichenifustis flavocetrariae]MCW6508676.1 glycosyltransferase [Lichenifustis flavocetrariae]